MWKWVSPTWPKVRRSDGEKGKLTLRSVKHECQLIVRLKTIKSIEELLCSLFSYINFQSSDLCSLKPIGIMMMGAFGLIVDCSMGWGWSLLPLLSIWLSLVWSIFEAIHFTHELHAWVLGVAIKTRYHFHKSDFHRFHLSLKQFTSLMNCTLSSTIYLGSNVVMTAIASSHKSRFICYFKIATSLREIVFW